MNTSSVRLIAARVLVGPSLDLRLDHVVEIEHGRIAAVRPRTADDDGVAAGTEDLGDVTVLPGLVDAHQHLAFDASTEVVDRLLATDDDTLLRTMHANATRALAAGITTIRDLGDRGYLSLVLRDRFAAGTGEDVGPRIVASGPPITTRRGHCWFLGGEVDDLGGVDGEQGVRAAVRERVAHGVDVVKVMASGGVMTPTVGPHESQLRRVELEAIVDEAHAAGLPVAAHAHGGGAIADALAAGADSIEHCTFLSEDGVDPDPAVMTALAGARCWISATNAVLPGAAPLYPAMRERLARVVDALRDLHDAGGRIVCSSDAGIAPNKPHDVLPHGVTGFLAGLGLTNAEALRNVTSEAAELCGIADRTGSVEAGLDADLLVVRGNPLDDLAAVHDVVGVYARGRAAAVSRAGVPGP